MPIPKRGCIVKNDGTIVSAWEWNNPGFPPLTQLLIEDPNENRTQGYAFDDVIIDLDAVIEPGDMSTFYTEQHELRCTKANGKWKFTKMRDGIELPSEFEALIQGRRAKKATVSLAQLTQETIE